MSEKYEPIDYRVDKDLKSIKAKKERINTTSQKSIWLFIIIMLASALLIYYQVAGTNSSDTIKKLENQVSQQKEENKNLTDELNKYKNENRKLKKDSQKIADSLTVHYSNVIDSLNKKHKLEVDSLTKVLKK